MALGSFVLVFRTFVCFVVFAGAIFGIEWLVSTLQHDWIDECTLLLAFPASWASIRFLPVLSGKLGSALLRAGFFGVLFVLNSFVMRLLWVHNGGELMEWDWIFPFYQNVVCIGGTILTAAIAYFVSLIKSR